jgi:hypothetical protein
MVVELSAQSSPTAVFAAAGADINVYGYINVTVVDTKGVQYEAFVLNGTVTVDGSAYLIGSNVIAGNLTYAG